MSDEPLSLDDEPLSLDDDEPVPRKRRPWWRWPLRIVGGSFAAFVLFAIVGAILDKPRDRDGGGSSESRVYAREEFKKLVMGKTPDEVLKSVGKPRITGGEGLEQTWYFDGVTRNPVTDKLDRMVPVHFENGRVVSVNF